MRPRVLLADDHQLLREAFALLLEPSCDVVGVFADGRALLSAAPVLRPDVVILDLAMPLLNGMDAARQLRTLMPGVRIIILTINEDADVAAQALRCGVSGYLLKHSAASELMLAVEEAMHGRSYITPLIAKDVMNALAHDTSGHDNLGEGHEIVSVRQREVLQLLAEGKSMKQIATILHITSRTVAFHKYGMMKQVGARSNADLIKLAVRLGVASSLSSNGDSSLN